MTEGNEAGVLDTLAERCEQATGPDRELDIEIVVAIDWREPDWEEGERTAREMADRHGLPWLTSRSVEGYSSTWRHLPRFTASLDAAKTLIPEGWQYYVASDHHGNHACVNDATRSGGCRDASTDVLALCAAALRARSTQRPPLSDEGMQ